MKFLIYPLIVLLNLSLVASNQAEASVKCKKRVLKKSKQASSITSCDYIKPNTSTLRSLYKPQMKAKHFVINVHLPRQQGAATIEVGNFTGYRLDQISFYLGVLGAEGKLEWSSMPKNWTGAIGKLTIPTIYERRIEKFFIYGNDKQLTLPVKVNWIHHPKQQTKTKTKK